VIGSLVALILMGLAGWFLYAKWSQNNDVLANLNNDYEELKRLNSQVPHPGSGSINNIQLAKDQRTQLLDFMKKTGPYFAPIPRIPDLPKITDRDFSAALSHTIEQLRAAATNASVSLPAENYSFSFAAQKSKISFAAGSLDRVAVQLGEIRMLAEILFDAKINALDGLRRERVSQDDSFGLQTDYLGDKTTTNTLAVLTPYEITFRAFSTELAAVLAGFANSPHALLVKSVNVELAPAVAAPEPVAITPQYIMVPQAGSMQPEQQQANAQAAFASRYGLGAGAQSLGVSVYGGLSSAPPPNYAPPPTGVPGAALANKGGLPTVLDEKLLKITLDLYLVKPPPSPSK
jgi:hypothetical protein